jgi:hypothetical protein
MWTPHHFDTCIALVGDCMAQCSLSKTHGQFFSCYVLKNVVMMVFLLTALFLLGLLLIMLLLMENHLNLLLSLLFIKRKSKKVILILRFRAYYESLQFDISPLNWIPSKKSSKSDSNDSSIQKSIESSTDEKSNKKAEDDSHHISNNDQHLTCELPDGAYSWSHSGIDYLAVDFPNGDKNIFDSNSFEHIGIFNSKAKRLIRY